MSTESELQVAALHCELTKTGNCLLLRQSHSNSTYLPPGLRTSCTASPPAPSPVCCSSASPPPRLYCHCPSLSLAVRLPAGPPSSSVTAGLSRRTVSILRELEHRTLYNPLEHDLGGLDMARERLAKAPPPSSHRGRGRGSSSRGAGPYRRGVWMQQCL